MQPIAFILPCAFGPVLILPSPVPLFGLRAMSSFPSKSGIALSPAPSDGVCAVKFSPCGSAILVAGWSGELALHSSLHGTLSATAALPCAALAAAYVADAAYAAALDGGLYRAVATQSSLASAELCSGAHGAAASCVVSFADGCVGTAGWDSKVLLRDMKAGGDGGRPGLVTDEIPCGERVYAMDTVGDHCLAAVTAAKRVRVVDRRKANHVLHDILPSLNAPLRTVSASPRSPVLVVGSTDGRVSVESMDSAVAPSFAFKCHRADGRAYPVNAIAYNHKYGSFATGGGDGTINVWDGVARKRIYQYPREPTSIASIAFSPDDSQMALAVSYTFEDGECDHPPDAVLVRSVEDNEIRTREAGPVKQ